MQSFPEQVYSLVRSVPRGYVTSYGRLARSLGRPRGGRQVGWALARTPANMRLNAHRVVGHDGTLSGGWAFGAPEVQRAMLEAEGIEFLIDGRVNLARFLWPDELLGRVAGTLQSD